MDKQIKEIKKREYIKDDDLPFVTGLFIILIFGIVNFLTSPFVGLICIFCGGVGLYSWYKKNKSVVVK